MIFYFYIEALLLAQGQCYIQLYIFTPNCCKAVKEECSWAGISNAGGLILLEVASYLLKHAVSRGREILAGLFFFRK